MHHVLFITYYFPPAGGAGVQRPLKFVKYLPDYGWLPIVLTVKPQAYPLIDESMEREIPPSVKVIRAPALLLPKKLPWRVRNFIARWLLIVDQQLGWLPFAIHQGLRIINSENISAIYTTSAPYTSHLIGLWLHKLTGTPWIADFRDPWIRNFSRSFPTRFHLKIALRLEETVCRNADSITVVSAPMRDMLLEYHGKCGNIHIITNGYDAADFSDVDTSVTNSLSAFTIVYTGSFYKHRLRPDTFLEGLRNTLNAYHIDVNVIFAGNISARVSRLITALGLSEVVTITGYLPHHRSIEYLMGADVLLLIIGPGPGSEAVFTGKIFEYLAAGKPILALVPPGPAADLIREAQAGVIVPPDDVEAISAAILELYDKWKRGDLRFKPRMDIISRFERRRLTGLLAELLDTISAQF